MTRTGAEADKDREKAPDNDTLDERKDGSRRGQGQVRGQGHFGGEFAGKQRHLLVRFFTPKRRNILALLSHF
jgi:hypothetical protein